MGSSSSLAEDKAALRRVMRERREALGAPARARLSQAVSQRLSALPEVTCAAVIAGFQALPGEVDVSAALAAAAGRGAALVFPRVSEQVPRLRFHRVGGEDDLVVGAFGVREPAAHLPEVPVEDIDLFVLPGLAFDATGRRIGYGGGYYDEVAARVREGRPGGRQFSGGGVLVGVGFDIQMVERCPAGQGDVAIDLVVTDARVVRSDSL